MCPEILLQSVESLDVYSGSVTHGDIGPRAVPAPINGRCRRGVTPEGAGRRRQEEKVSFDTIEELSKGNTLQMTRNKLMRAVHSHSLPSHFHSNSQLDTEGLNTDNGR